MSASYGSNIPTFFLNGDYGEFLHKLKNCILDNYSQINISNETVNIANTANPSSPFGRNYQLEFCGIMFKCGFYIVYPTELETSKVDKKDIISVCISKQEFYSGNRDGYIPKLLDVNDPDYFLYENDKNDKDNNDREYPIDIRNNYKSQNLVTDYNQYINRLSFLCITLDCNEDNLDEIRYYCFE